MTLLMGILNLTPDSFSDGGAHLPEPEAGTHPGLEHARRMAEEGAAIIDVGGESTRPGAEPVAPAEEQRRILPVLQPLLEEGVTVSVDTRHPDTARAALQTAGDRASELIINDVSGLLTAPQMPQVIAEYGAQIVITHNRGDSQTMQQLTDYDDVVAEVLSELETIRSTYLDAGVSPEQIIVDPGIGFAKTHQQNWELIRNLDRFVALGHRVLFGASRKGFLGALLADGQDRPRPAAQRDAATAALSFHAACAGCWAVRVHAVAPNADALRAAAALNPAA